VCLPARSNVTLGPFDCAVTVTPESARIVVSARDNHEFIMDDYDKYSLTLTNATTGEVLAHHEREIVYGLASPPGRQCVAADGPFCRTIEIVW
jgi:hypothetical protein